MKKKLTAVVLTAMALWGGETLGFGAVMHEYAQRFWALYYAVEAGNWELAVYELHEQLEAQEMGEALRPKLAGALKTFEKSSLAPLQKAIEEKNLSAFKKAYADATRACNACHKSTGHGYIRFQLPKTPPPLLAF